MTDDTAYHRLRSHAERIVRNEAVELSEEERLDLLRLAHELETARAELETANEELRRTHRDLEAVSLGFYELYEEAPVAYVSLSPKGIVTRANAAARKLLTGAGASPVGRGFTQFIRPESMRYYFRQMRPQGLGNSPRAFDLELLCAGEPVQVHVQAAPKFNAENHFQHWHLAFFDITAMRRREAELEAVHAQLSLAARAAGIGTWVYDLEAKTVKWNRGLYRLLRLKPAEGVETPLRFMEFIHPDDRTRVFKDLGSLRERKEDEIRQEFRVIRADGQVRWLADRGRVFRDGQGRPVRIAGINYDITERKQEEETVRLAQLELARQLAETERSNRELSEYAYAVSHDLKAPLRAMRNYADFLYEDLAGTLTGDQKTYLDGMRSAVQQGENLINDLLDLSRLDSMLIEQEPADMPAIVSEIQALLAAEDLTIAVANRWPAILADHMILRQILRNLISNAAKFNRRNPRRITVGWQEAAEDGIEIFVRDNGIGIAPQYHEQIFRIFQRLHTPQEYEGTGIGLAIVRKAAYKLGGDVRLESEPGKGSTFFVWLPNKEMGSRG